MLFLFRNDRPRLQRSVRRGGRVVTEYIASGSLALAFDECNFATALSESMDAASAAFGRKLPANPQADYIRPLGSRGITASIPTVIKKSL